MYRLTYTPSKCVYGWWGRFHAEGLIFLFPPFC
jgi:hypothetical protein